VRTNALKTLLKEYRKTYNKIAVVSHYNIIRFILATEFNQKDEPFDCHIGNCEVRKVLVNDLWIKYSYNCLFAKLEKRKEKRENIT